MGYSVQIERSVDSLTVCLNKVNDYIEDIWEWDVRINAGGIDYGIYFNFDLESKKLEISNRPEYDEGLYLDDIIDIINESDNTDE